MANVAMQRQFSMFNAGGNEQFPDPFADVASQCMPDTMRNALYWCFPAGAPIELDGGQLRPIEAVKPGDVVLTRGGTAEPVVRTSQRPYTGALARIEFAGMGKRLPLRLTANHKVWRIPTAKLKPGRVAEAVTLDRAEKVAASEVVAGDYFATPLPRRDWREPAAHPPGWPVRQSRFSGWLTGMYAAEGCPIRNAALDLMACRFTLGAADESNGVLAALVTHASAEVGRAQTAYTPRSQPNTRLVTVCDPELPDWLLEHVPGNARTKRLADCVFGYDDEFLLGLLGGFLDGDGNIGSDAGKFKGLIAWSASYTLLYQLQRVAYCVGLTPSLCEVDNARGFATGIAANRAYALTFGKHDAQRLVPYSVKAAQAQRDFADFAPRSRGRQDVFVRDGYVFHRVRHVAREAYRGLVYNFEVARDHSYIAHGVAVANCQYIFQSMGTYRMAMERVISYFLTDIEIGGDEVSDDEKDKWEEFLSQTIDTLTTTQDMLRDRVCYGNAFASIIVPFKRFLQPPDSGDLWPLKEVHRNPKFKFAWQNFEFVATNPRTGRRGAWKIVDKPDDEEKRIKIKRWSPHEIELLHDPYTDDVAYLWRIPEDYRKLVKDGNLFHLERASEQVLRAIQHNQVFRFHPDVIFHMKEPTLAGVRNRGWGIPRIISNFRQIYYVQVLRRFNEAIALDYVIPFRLITPMGRPGTGAGGLPMMDPMMSYNGGDFRNQVLAMIRKRRRDPSAWQVLPFPVEYKALGGDATQLAPRDLLDQGMETLLNDAGTPVELYKGSLQLQAAPVALRLFESTWHHLVHDTNAFLRWLVKQVAQIMSWEMVEANLKRVTVADDMQKQMAALQLYMGQQLSGRSALSGIGYDWDTEQKRIAEESRKQQELQARIQEEMEQAGFAQQIAKGQGAAGAPAGPGGAPAAGGAAAGGAAPAGGAGQPNAMSALAGGTPVSDYIASMGPNTPVTPNEMTQVAGQLAQELLGKPEGVKDSELRKLKQFNEVLHSLVRSQMDKTRQQVKTQAGGQAMQQMQMQGGGAPAG